MDYIGYSVRHPHQRIKEHKLSTMGKHFNEELNAEKLLKPWRSAREN